MQERELVTGIIYYSLKKIELAEEEINITGQKDFWNGNIQGYVNLLQHLDRVIGDKAQAEDGLPDVYRYCEITKEGLLNENT